MQAITNQEAAPKAPAAPLPPTSITTVGSDGKTVTLSIPRTSDEVAALRARREEISSQLNSVTERRDELVQQVRSAPEGAARTGLEDRIRLLDQRLLGLEGDLASIGSQLAMVPPNLITYSEDRGQSPAGDPDAWEEGLVVGGGAVLLGLALLKLYQRFTRRTDKRVAAKNAPAIAADSARLERLEQGVEAIAIEVERISEGQRFVTRLLSESNQQEVPAQTIKG
jgi:hypothetical protein